MSSRVPMRSNGPTNQPCPVWHLPGQPVQLVQPVAANRGPVEDPGYQPRVPSEYPYTAVTSCFQCGECASAEPPTGSFVPHPQLCKAASHSLAVQAVGTLRNGPILNQASGDGNGGIGPSTNPHNTSSLGSNRREANSSQLQQNNKRVGEDAPDQRGDKRQKQVDASKPPFGCPFFFHDRKGHRACLAKKLSRVGDVRQHIMRCHLAKSYCANCGDTFDNDPKCTRRDAHVAASCCEQRPLNYDRVTRDQEDQMKHPARPIAKSERERWYQLWEIIFPNDTPPSSPYLIHTPFLGYVCDASKSYQRDGIFQQHFDWVSSAFRKHLTEAQLEYVREISWRMVDCFAFHTDGRAYSYEDAACENPLLQASSMNLRTCSNLSASVPQMTLPLGQASVEAISQGFRSDEVLNGLSYYPAMDNFDDTGFQY
ncbi:hypothetical protein F4818DRAFT_374524 [Hypoxylon cercidicola]|nr:hypothetical protein F4818DRAFT_374524 [Hypoxylon cercidicola]